MKMSPTKQKIKIKFQNGLTFNGFKEEVFDKNGLSDLYDFEESNHPDFVVFGPYGHDLPTKGSAVRIGYYCECITPDLSNCEWAFGVPREEEINNPRYTRIQWHGINPEMLVKKLDTEEDAEKKTKFCNFLYSNSIPYREAFFKQLSKYKKIDSPGKSMNNMAAIDRQYQGNTWETKRQFLSPYKFTIAFESYAYAGYQTEKLYDAMQMNSIPIYCGDPRIDEIFNEKSFINTADYLPVCQKGLKNYLERNCQYTFNDYLPGTYRSINYRIRRKLKTIGKQQKMKFQLNNFDFTPLIDRIIHLDQNPQAYSEMLNEPWLKSNKPPIENNSKIRWIDIFNGTNPY